ncbi:Pre-mRNA-splicing helicase BRR2 [Rhodotorula kratochvilovae]
MSLPRLEQCGVLTADGLVKGGEELPKAVSALWQQHKAEERARWEQEWATAKAALDFAILNFIADASRFLRYHDIAQPEGDGRGQKVGEGMQCGRW